MTIPIAFRSFCIVADDLSGAADCAAALARPSAPVPVALGVPATPSGRLAIDTDSRAMELAAALAVTERVFLGIAPSDLDHSLVYKKIDSTLRGHVAAELRAALDAVPQFAGAVVAPSFPEQGRTFSGGKLCLNGRPVDGPGHEGDLMSMLAAAGLQPALLRQPGGDPAQVVLFIEHALVRGARAIVVDAANPDELARLATALCAASVPLLMAGSAGLARALSPHLAPPVGSAAQAGAAPAAGGPVLALVGSFSQASAAQVRQLEASAAARVIRLDAQQWLAQDPATGRRAAIDAASQMLRAGRDVLLAIAGEVAQPFSRALVQAMARAAAPLLQHAGTCVLTGGDTARALFNELGASELQVTGEFEPGISLARIASRASPQFVLKAGGFGDALALQRIIQSFGPQRRPSSRLAAAPT